MTVTRDALSGWYCPASAAEWTELLAGTGIGNPSNLWGCQDASGNLTDAIGTAPLVPTGVLADLSYEVVIPGWSRFAAQVNTDGVNARWASTDASLPNISTTSAFLLVYWVGPQLPINATREISKVGGSSGGQLRTSGGKTLLVTLSGGNTASGTALLTNSVQLIGIRINRTNSTVSANDLFEQISPTFAAGMTGVGVYLGGNSGDALSGIQGFLMAALWSGSNAELTDAQLQQLYSLIQNGPSVQPNFEDVVIGNDNTLMIAGEALVLGSDAGSKSFVFSNNVGALNLAANPPSANQTLNLPDASGTAGLITAFSAGTVLLSNQLLILSNSNNVSFGMDSNGNVTMSASFPPGVNDPVSAIGVSNLGNTAGNTGSTSGQYVLAGAGGLSLSQATGATIATVSLSFTESTGIGGIAASGGFAASGTATSGTVVFANSNGISFGMSASSRVTATMDYVRSISAGTTNATGNQIVFSNSDGLSFGANGATITMTAPALSYWENRHDLRGSVNVSGGIQSLASVQPATFPLGISATQLDVVMNISAQSSLTGNYTMNIAAYTFAGSTASLASSAQAAVSWASGTASTTASLFGGQTGVRYRSISLGTWNITPGEYLLMLQCSIPPSNITANILVGATNQPFIQDPVAQGNYSYYFGEGLVSVTAIGLPNSFQLSDLLQTGILSSSPVAQPYMRLIGTF